MPIQFFSENTSFQLENPVFYDNWLRLVIAENNKKEGEINYIFCTDDQLLKINQEHLNHDFYTDIITFDNSEDDETIEADIYISTDRVNENSSKHSAGFSEELSRVMVHGILHLLGFDDKTEDQKKVMREKEDAYISLQKN